MSAREIPLAEVQDIEFDVLLRLREYCREHNLTYCLCGGTLLGAVRHKGFIPWDDDIDLFMPREDYDRFLQLSRETPVAGHIEVLGPGDKNYPYPLIKVVNRETVAYEQNITDPRQAHGVGLDIFPLDRMYPRRRRNLFLLAWVKFLIQLSKTNARMVRSDRSSLKKRVRSLVMALLKPLAHCTPYSRLNRKIDSIASGRRHLRTYMLGNVAWPNRWKDMFPAEVFAEWIDLPFRGENFPAPKQYDAYLTTLYGDYMQIPKAQDRVAHSFRAYWKKDLEEERK